jgi:hypothetical protein
MAKKTSHYYQFTYQAMPILFHSSSKDFMNLLDRDGMKFLEFWWNQTGESGEVEEKKPSDGLTYQVRDFKGDKKLVLITLPAPKKAPEAYFLAMLTPPSKRYWLPWMNFSRIFALQRGKVENGKVLTRLAELTPRGFQRDLCAGTEPDLEKFCQLVRDQFK